MSPPVWCQTSARVQQRPSQSPAMTVTLQARAGHWHWPLALELKAGSARLLASATLAARLEPMHYIRDSESLLKFSPRPYTCNLTPFGRLLNYKIGPVDQLKLFTVSRATIKPFTKRLQQTLHPCTQPRPRQRQRSRQTPLSRLWKGVIWEFAPKIDLRISQDIPRYPKISVHEDKYGYLFKDIKRYLLDMSGYLLG
jgi:hypothetical protein